jgi:predicted RNA-binding Zn ribbon-like protein
MFLADARGLDFLNSIATPEDVPVEWLRSGKDLLAWLVQAELVPEAVAKDLERKAVPGEIDVVAAQARALREWFRGFVHKRKGKPLKQSALEELEPLNELLSRDQQFGQVTIRNQAHSHDHPSSGVKWNLQRHWRSPDMLLQPIARAIADLICEDDFTHIKACEGPTCTLLFVDRNRGHARRWCSMAICGNRAKQAAHRKRSKRS